MSVNFSKEAIITSQDTAKDASILDQFVSQAEFSQVEPLDFIDASSELAFQKSLRKYWDSENEQKWIQGRYVVNGISLPTLFRIKKVNVRNVQVGSNQREVAVLGITDGHALELDYSEIDAFANPSTKNETTLQLHQKRLLGATYILFEAIKELVAKAEHAVYASEHSIDTDDHTSALLATLENVMNPQGDQGGWFKTLNDTGRYGLTVASTDIHIASLSHDLHNKKGVELSKRIQGLTRTRMLGGVRAHEFSITSPVGLGKIGLFVSPTSMVEGILPSSSPLKTASDMAVEHHLSNITHQPELAIHTLLQLANENAPVSELHKEVKGLRRPQ